jgi:hypothetical protein
VNAGIGTIELIEQNERTVNDIYLNTIAKDESAFTATQATALYAVAIQCPMAGGQAVFRARALYGLFDDAQDYDDASTCLSLGIVFRNLEQSDPPAVTVIPNPASDNITVYCVLEPDETGTLILFDALGAEAIRYPMTGRTQQQVFSVSRLSQGAYHYRVYTARGQLGEGKLTIIR